MTVIRPPHNELVEKSFENPLVVKEFFDRHLPIEIKKRIDLSTVKPQKGDFINLALKKSITDMLFSVKIDNEDGYIVLLLEHQSQPDYWRLCLYKCVNYSKVI